MVARIAISPSFPNLLYTVGRSSNVSPLPDTFSTLFFFRDNFDGEVFLKKVCCKRWRRSINRTLCPQLHVQDRRFRRTTIAFVKGQSVSKNYFSLCKNISSASCVCVEGRLKAEKIQGCWFVDGKIPSIRMQVRLETFSLISFLNNVIESVKQKKIYTPCNLVLKPLLE